MKKEIKYNWKEISKAIDSVWRSSSHKDDWNVPVIYKGMFKGYLKKKLSPRKPKKSNK